MANLRNLTVALIAAGLQPATEDTHFLRLGEFRAIWSGLAARDHTHDSDDIVDFGQAVLDILAGYVWSGVPISLKPNGGILDGVDGLYVDSGIVSLVGHRHGVGDIDDFDAGVALALASILQDTDSTEWDFSTPGEVSLDVRLKPAGGLGVDGDGLYVDSGIYSRVGHTHSQLHNPVTFEESNTLIVSLVDQDIGLEVWLATNGGLTVSSGVHCDFGAGHNQVARGDHTHAELHPALTVQDTTSLHLVVGGAQVLSGNVRLDPAPADGFGKIAVGSAGLSVELGEDADQAARGDHGHAVATMEADGFMSALDKFKLELLNQAFSGVVAVTTTQAFSFTREMPFIPGEYLMGRAKWPRLVTLVSAEILALTSQGGDTEIEMEIDGVPTGRKLYLLGGGENEEWTDSVSLGSAPLSAGAAVRWKINSGPAADLAAWKGSLTMVVDVAGSVGDPISLAQVDFINFLADIPDANFRVRDGQAQIYDVAQSGWRPVGINNGVFEVGGLL